MTAIQKKPDNAIAHLSPADIEELGRSLDAIREHTCLQGRRARVQYKHAVAHAASVGRLTASGRRERRYGDEGERGSRGPADA